MIADCLEITRTPDKMVKQFNVEGLFLDNIFLLLSLNISCGSERLLS